MTMPFTIRPLAARDFEQAAALHQLLYPNQIDQPAEWRRLDQQRVPSPPHRWVALDQGTDRIVGYGAFWHVRLDKYRLDLIVHPDRRQQGIGSQLLTRLLDCLRSLGAVTVQARADANADASLRFLVHRGYVETQRMQELVLEVTEITTMRHATPTAQLKSTGIAVTTLAEEAKRGDAFWDKLLDFQNAVARAWPDPDPGPVSPLTMETFQQMAAGWHFIPEAFYLAARSDQYVGYSGLAEPASMHTPVESVGTAVRPEYRGQGIASVLKGCCLTYAQRHGFERLITHSANPAMVHINETFGFRRGPTEVRLVKRLDNRS
jgi:GNAT superfamily N-acetyltransferase